ncbi:MAG: hypothetical protein CL961_07160 [Euryarchaeota archaeon]|nr:hypothetical protein [Euryarchaeota archaeon]|tara:strand:+ start:15665 stop:23911 length:8247 start_codon:yes stop_codon:yes gene_type:complete
MPQKTNLNVSPYFEDFDDSKNFYKILFRPGYSIQGRELTQLQSVLQNQIESIGKNAFKQGELIVPGEVGLNNKLDYVKLSSVSEVAVNEGGAIVYRKYDISQLVGQQLRGLTSGVVANLVSVQTATETTADTLFVTYLTSGNAGNENTFRQGETLEVVDGVNTPLLVVGTDGSVLPTTVSVVNPDTQDVTVLESRAMGYASAVKVEEGIYFVNGYFVRNDEELFIIDPYYNAPSAIVGFRVEESIVTPEEDPSLYDNAIGSSNFSAPGAHRLSIKLNLEKYDLSATTDKNFIKILTVKSGVIQKQIKPTDYTVLEETLARRTYDESGDYVVDRFDVGIREYYQNDGNNGLYAQGDDGLVNGLSLQDASQKMVANVGAGKAYIRGYEIVNKETKYLEVNKARETVDAENVTLKTTGLPTYPITNVYGSIPFNAEGSELTAYPDVELYNVYNDGTVGQNIEFASGQKSAVNPNRSGVGARASVDRRGELYGDSLATVTVTVDITNGTGAAPTLVDKTLDGSLTFEECCDSNGKLYLAFTYSGGYPDTYKSVDLVGFSIKQRDDVVAQKRFAELTLLGDKAVLKGLVKTYDIEDTESRRQLYLEAIAGVDDQGNVLNPTSAILGNIQDFSEVTTPLIGVAKPGNYTLKETGFGFNPDADVVVSKGKLSGGQSAYNGIFGLGYFAPSFYTKIILESDIAVGTFEKGKYIFGITSGAYGVIEGSSGSTFSTGNELMITALSGKFVSGEVIRDEDDNSAKIATDNTISHFIVKNRGSGGYEVSTNGTAGTAGISINGVSFDTSKVNVFGNIDGNVFGIDILNRGVFGQTYSQPPVVTVDAPSSGTITTSAKIDAVLFRNTVQTYTPNDVKSFGCAYGSGGNNLFTADLEASKSPYAKLIPVTDFTFTGGAGSRFLECNGFNGDTTVFLKQGDYIQFTDSAGAAEKVMVAYATKPEGTLKSRIYLDTALAADVVNGSVVKVECNIENSSKGSLLYPTGGNQVASISQSNEDSKISYFYRKDFITEAASSGGNITFTAQLPFGTQRFARFTPENFVMTVLNPGSSTKVATGDVIYLTEANIINESTTDAASGLNAGSIKVNLPQEFFGTSQEPFPTLKLSATLELSKARPRIKSVVRNRRILIKSAGDRIVPLRGENFDTEATNVSTYSDVFKLKYIYEGTSSSPPTIDSAGNLVSGVDVTERFTFDDGQRDTFYDVSRIVLKPGFEAPVGQLVVAFDYFEHSQGDFCTVDSYLHEAGVTLEEIPTFNSAVHGILSLKNVFDFRPKVDSSSFVTGFQDQSSREAILRNFIGEGGVASVVPAPDKNLEFTFKFTQTEFLNRIDGVFLTKRGQFVLKEGNSSQNPTKPELIDDAIPLYYFYVPAFTKNSKDVRILPVDNRRYTMKDIGKLEKRIERLEYYTTLSVLEQQALNMQIRDTIGFDRFKTGFVVDNFETHGIGEISSEDYKCAIDTQQSVLRSPNKEDSFRLEEINTTTDQRFVDGYVRTGDLVTLPYTELEVLGNSFATKTINPNPFVALQYVGEGHLDPQIDSWYDQEVEPVIVDNNTGLYSIFISKDDTTESFSSIFNSFVINWIGSKGTFGSIASFGKTNTDSSIEKVTRASVASSSNVSPDNNEIGKGIATDSDQKGTVATSLKFYARSTAVKFTVQRLKPLTTLYPFLEGNDISRWTCPDSRFTGIAGNSSIGFNAPITTDENGNASGIIIIPGGVPPVENATWTGNIDTVSYDATQPELRIVTGIKTIRFTSSRTNDAKDTVDSYADLKYYALGKLPQNPPTINSTGPAYFKANEGVQKIDSVTDVEIKPNPLAQTFSIESFEGGLFVTSAELYFNKKSTNIPIRVYLTNTEIDKPAKHIIPGAEATLSPNTLIRAYSNGTTTLTVGENIVGSQSACSGPLLKVLDSTNIEVTASADGKVIVSSDQVYTLVLSNHNGREFIQNENLIIDSITEFNNKNNTNLGLTIAKDSGRVTDLIVEATGQSYDSAFLTFESPQLAGGSQASGAVKISEGRIYDASVSLGGSGYTAPPAIVIKGVGSGNGGGVVTAKITIDNPAVRMGVAVDTDGTTNSTIPTKFKFKNPVYLQNGSQYALVIETDSTEYMLWSSRLGETEIVTSSPVTTQPLLGSVYKAQNTDNWTEDLFEDIKFKLNRAEFDTTRGATLKLSTENPGYEYLKLNPYETSGVSDQNATSPLFKLNNKVVKVYHKNHGFEDGGKSYVFYSGADGVGGVSSTQLNTKLFRVTNAGIDSYNITNDTTASNSVKGGGGVVLAAYNRKFERLFPQVNYLSFSDTTVTSSVKTTNIIPVDSDTENYVSYSQTVYEKTFLNEIQYFTNQKVLASRINQVMNNIDRSIEYKIDFNSDITYLSPAIDLSSASVITSSNRIENASGKEDRYGRRDALLRLKEVYSFVLGNLNGQTILSNQEVSIEAIGSTVAGLNGSQAKGTIARVVEVGGDTIVYVRVSTINPFSKNDQLSISGIAGNPTVTSDPVKVTFGGTAGPVIPTVGATVTARNVGFTGIFTAKIEGKVTFFDINSQEITVKNDKKPFGSTTFDQTLAEASVVEPSVARSGESVEDIFRVGDILSYTGQEADESAYWEVKEIEYTDGIDYAPENRFVNSSSIAKYVTKEISIGNPGTSINVKLTANIKDVSDIQVLFRYKESSSQESFDVIEYQFFNGTGLPDFDVVASAENTISSITEKQTSYQELEYSVSDLPEFSSFGIKIVMKSDNPAYVPKIQDMRAVASY